MSDEDEALARMLAAQENGLRRRRAPPEVQPPSKRAAPPAVRSQNSPRATARKVWVVGAEKQRHEVESLADRRKTASGDEYFVKWVGFPHTSNSWEPAYAFKGDVKRLLRALDDSGHKQARAFTNSTSTHPTEQLPRTGSASAKASTNLPPYILSAETGKRRPNSAPSANGPRKSSHKRQATLPAPAQTEPAAPSVAPAAGSGGAAVVQVRPEISSLVLGWRIDLPAVVWARNGDESSKAWAKVQKRGATFAVEVRALMIGAVPLQLFWRIQHQDEPFFDVRTTEIYEYLAPEEQLQVEKVRQLLGVTSNVERQRHDDVCAALEQPKPHVRMWQAKQAAAVAKTKRPKQSKPAQQVVPVEVEELPHDDYPPVSEDEQPFETSEQEGEPGRESETEGEGSGATAVIEEGFDSLSYGAGGASSYYPLDKMQKRKTKKQILKEQPNAWKGGASRKGLPLQTDEEVAVQYSELYRRLPRQLQMHSFLDDLAVEIEDGTAAALKVSDELSKEFHDKELRIFLTYHGVLINHYSPYTKRYTEKTKCEKIKIILGLIHRGALKPPPHEDAGVLLQPIHRPSDSTTSATVQGAGGGLSLDPHGADDVDDGSPHTMVTGSPQPPPVSMLSSTSSSSSSAGFGPSATAAGNDGTDFSWTASAAAAASAPAPLQSLLSADSTTSSTNQVSDTSASTAGAAAGSTSASASSTSTGSAHSKMSLALHLNGNSHIDASNPLPLINGVGLGDGVVPNGLRGTLTLRVREAGHDHRGSGAAAAAAGGAVAGGGGGGGGGGGARTMKGEPTMLRSATDQPILLSTPAAASTDGSSTIVHDDGRGAPSASSASSSASSAAAAAGLGLGWGGVNGGGIYGGGVGGVQSWSSSTYQARHVGGIGGGVGAASHILHV
jgi:hypothetical protein